MLLNLTYEKITNNNKKGKAYGLGLGKTKRKTEAISKQ